MKICITSDDTAQFTKEEIEQAGNLYIVRVPIIINGEAYFQNETIDDATFFKRLASDDDVQTSQPSPGELMELWAKLLKEYDAIIHIPLSSGLSEACNSAKMISQEDEFQGKVFVCDNHRVEPTLRESVRDALRLSEAGYSPEEIQKTIVDEGPNSSIYLMVDTLKYLKKGGRVTPAAALLGGALHVKPILAIFGGKLDAYQKVIGSKKARKVLIDAIRKDMNEKFKGIDKKDLYFGAAYSNNKEEAEEFIKEAAAELGVDSFELRPLSLVVSTHTGPGVLALTVTKKALIK